MVVDIELERSMGPGTNSDWLNRNPMEGFGERCSTEADPTGWAADTLGPTGYERSIIGGAFLCDEVCDDVDEEGERYRSRRPSTTAACGRAGRAAGFLGLGPRVRVSVKECCGWGAAFSMRAVRS